MKLLNISLKNFRSIEDLSVDFPSFYSAISGKNNSGKSNLLRVLKSLFEPEGHFKYKDNDVKFQNNFPAWKSKDAKELIQISLRMEIDRIRDAAIFKLADEFFKVDSLVNLMILELSADYSRGRDHPEQFVSYGTVRLDSFKSKTIFQIIKNSGVFQFYNSTEPDDPFGARNQLTDLFGELSKGDRLQLGRDRDKLSKTISNFAKKHQKDISDLLGRLEEKYTVGFSAPKLTLDFLPINITLGDKKLDVALDEWGSGTRNRTHILLTLFKAKKLSESPDADTKLAPILVIEEPESFLHPSAQAEFGRLIQDLCEEFKVQVLVATHSPYFLSQQHPESNILLCRNLRNGQLRETERVEVNLENWMEPFAQNLGLANPEFEPWKDLFFSRTNKILLVEGDIDKEYFEMLRSDEHGENRLNFEGEIFSYGGIGSLSNGVLLRFIKGRYENFFITFDLDSEKELNKLFNGLNLNKGIHYSPIGKVGGGKDKIEGLLPSSVRDVVFGKNSDLIQQIMGGSGEEVKSAKSKIKRLLLENFKENAVPGEEYFGDFYLVVKQINNAMQSTK